MLSCDSIFNIFVLLKNINCSTTNIQYETYLPYDKLNSFMVKNKEETKRKILQAVGYIVRTEGVESLGVNKISKTAIVSKPLIYRYFGSLDQLIIAFFMDKDYWVTYQLKNPSTIDLNFLQQSVIQILDNQYKFFSDSEEMQQLILKSISKKNKLMRLMADKREEYNKETLQMVDIAFSNSTVNFRAVSAILVAGIYQLVLHGKNNGSTFCGIDLNSSHGKNEITKAMHQIIQWSFDSRN